jgi:sugar lactone lactonase YvrE
MIGGILLNADGKVLCSGIGGIAWVDPVTGASGMLLDAINGEPIRGVNEMIPDGHGGLYFGTLDIPAQVRREEMVPGGLYRLNHAGDVRLLFDGIGFPNGIGRSADSRRLYNNATSIGTFAYDLADGGSAGAPKLLLKKKDCDGLALDVEGGIWVSGYNTSELLCLAPDGSVQGRLATPAYGVSNLRFGGVDFRDLYVTATCPEVMADYQSGKSPTTRGSKILRTRSTIPGLPIPRTNFRIG